ncbi:MAG: type IV secretion system protein [Streptosporangiaceae bacterium]
MRRVRVPRKTGVVLAVVAAILVLLPRAGQVRGAAASHTSGHVAVAATTVADVTPAGGLCSVPGIGDIGGLLGLCALGSSGLTGELNNICQPSLPDPEPASSGIDAMVAPPQNGKQPATLYDEYGVAGDYWAATNLQCSDMTSLIGNNVAGMVLDVAKSIDRVTISIYQSAASEGILAWLQRVTDKLITSLGNAIYFPYLAVVIILAAIWLAWHGLIRKRATRTLEGTIWMVVACAAAIFLIGKPADVTGLGRGVSDGVSQALNAAFAKLPSPGPSACVPIQKGDPQARPASYSYASGNTVVDQNADELWTVLVCKPWLVGEFGTSQYSPPGSKADVVNQYARSLLWAQAIAVNEKPSQALIKAKQATYAGIASSIQANDPSAYPLFQGKQWTTRLEVGFAALFAAVVAGVLVLLISVTLILLKLSFLLLLIVGPFFLLIGAHPGFGRVVAMRWVEMLIGVLLKQAAVALVLSVLLYCYALIMGTSDSVLPWALKILMIALVTVGAFIYRKPFQHLFSAVGYGMIGSADRAEADLARAGAAARANTRSAATLAVPTFAAYRAARWAKRNPGQAASLAMAATGSGAAAAAAGLQAADAGTRTAADAAAAPDMVTAARASAPVATSGAAGAGSPGAAGVAAVGVGAEVGDGRSSLAARARAWATQAPSTAEPPPLNLPPRDGSAAAASAAGAPGARPVWPGGRVSQARLGAPLAGNAAQSAAASGAQRPAVPRPAVPRPAAPRPDPGQAWARPPRSQLPVPAQSGRIRVRRTAGPPPQRQAGKQPTDRQVPPPTRRPATSRGPADSGSADSPSANSGWASSAPRNSAPRNSAPRNSAPRNSGSANEGSANGSPANGSPAPGQRSPWPGQPTGPLAGRDPAQASERAVPFWLRPLRRK